MKTNRCNLNQTGPTVYYHSFRACTCAFVRTRVMRRFAACAIAWCLAVPVRSQTDATEYYVVNNNGAHIYGVGIEAVAGDAIVLKLPGGGSQRFRKGTYRSGHCPKPEALKTAESFIRDKKPDAALAALDDAQKRYGILGWGGRISLLEGRIHAAQDRPQEAEAAYRRGLEQTDDSDATRARIAVALVATLIDRDRGEEAERLLHGISTEDPEIGTYVFNTRGRLLAAQGLKREAVLQYLKTILLFPKAGAVRRDAYREVIALLEELGDDRYLVFEKQRKEDYPQ